MSDSSLVPSIIRASEAGEEVHRALLNQGDKRLQWHRETASALNERSIQQVRDRRLSFEASQKWATLQRWSEISSLICSLMASGALLSPQARIALLAAGGVSLLSLACRELNVWHTLAEKLSDSPKVQRVAETAFSLFATVGATALSLLGLVRLDAAQRQRSLIGGLGSASSVVNTAAQIGKTVTDYDASMVKARDLELDREHADLKRDLGHSTAALTAAVRAQSTCRRDIQRAVEIETPYRSMR
jgi:hypothetical protein